jgi:hypothetical protein
MGVHTYERLVSPKHIRIIILEPSSDPSSDLRFSFHQGSLDELEDGYETISYCWGVGLLTCPLYAPDGTTVKVTENLGHALRRFRLKEEKRPLWADAACINQNNNEEKAVQIPLMVEIFRKAKRVLAWLGSGRHEEEESMRSFGRLSRITEGRTFPDISQLKAFFGVDWFKRMWYVILKSACGHSRIASS